MVTADDHKSNRSARLPFLFAKQHGIFLQMSVQGLSEAVCRQNVSSQALAETRRFLGCPLMFRTVDPTEFDRLLTAAYAQGGDATIEIAENIGAELDLDSIVAQLPRPEDLLEGTDDAPIIRLINALLTQAIKEGASDIHIEPFEHRLAIRYRVDGVLREVLQPRVEIATLLVSRVKVMARLDIAEKRLPQDGRISLRLGAHQVDVRVSTIPSGPSERVVMRLLDKQAGRYDLEQLGIAPAVYDTLKELLAKPHGVILVTGPTGSGKTTSLYGMLDQLNDHTRNILTIEDPIEYYIDGIGQTQVNSRISMNFASGLRAILRQDPDIVMVGEIRDLETAEIVMQASLTGHLVLSTLHTNSAAGAVTRLRDMGVESFLLSSSLIGVLAQRLVRVLCHECKQADESADGGGFLRAVGCDACMGTGYRGRSGIFELLVIDDDLRRMIHDGAAEQDVESYAGVRSVTLAADGTRRVLCGDTSVEEVSRVTQQ